MSSPANEKGPGGTKPSSNQQAQTTSKETLPNTRGLDKDEIIVDNEVVLIKCCRRFPIVDCVLRMGEVPTVSFECPYCLARPARQGHKKHRHIHGEPSGASMKIGDFAGHRVAHCYNPASPFLRGGYFLRLVAVEPSCDELPTRKKDKHSKLTAWLREMSTVGGGCPPMPSVIKPLRAAKLNAHTTLLTPEQADRIVLEVTKQDDTFFLAKVVPDKRTERRPLALCDSRTMTIAVPSVGVLLGSLISELALLHVPGLGHPSPLNTERGYKKHKARIKRMVVAIVRDLPL